MSNTSPSLPDQFQLALTAYEAGQIDLAISASEKLLAENDKFGDAYNLLSAIAQDQGRLADAEAAARAALSTDPNNPIYLNTLVTCPL